MIEPSIVKKVLSKELYVISSIKTAYQTSKGDGECGVSRNGELLG